MTSLQDQYAKRFTNTLVPLASNLEAYIADLLKDAERIDRIVARAKTVDSFLKKSAKRNETGEIKYQDPFNEIQDQLGARIVVFFKSDVEPTATLMEKYFGAIECIRKEPERDEEFGYFGQHYIFLVPDQVVMDGEAADDAPDFFELQIKTLFQHAWSEASHDLIYKSTNGKLARSQRRNAAFTAAQAWGADKIFDEMIRELAPASNTNDDI